MPEKNRKTVTIYGRKYNIVAPESQDYISSIAEYVDSRIRLVYETNPTLSLDNACVLTALNIADDYFKTLERLDFMNYENDDTQINNDSNLEPVQEAIPELIAENKSGQEEQDTEKYIKEIASLKEMLKQKQEEINELLELI